MLVERVRQCERANKLSAPTIAAKLPPRTLARHARALCRSAELCSRKGLLGGGAGLSLDVMLPARFLLRRMRPGGLQSRLRRRLSAPARALLSRRTRLLVEVGQNCDVRSFATKKKKKAAATKGKGSRLQEALNQVEGMFGKGAVMLLDSDQVLDVETVSTGSLTLDHALGVGGFPKGRIVEIYGGESSGKTTLALHAIAEVQKQGGNCVFIDVEHALDPRNASCEPLSIDVHLACLSS